MASGLVEQRERRVYAVQYGPFRLQLPYRMDGGKHPRFVTDLTGDGRADIIGFGDDGIWVAATTATAASSPPPGDLLGSTGASIPTPPGCCIRRCHETSCAQAVTDGRNGLPRRPPRRPAYRGHPRRPVNHRASVPAPVTASAARKRNRKVHQRGQRENKLRAK
jgi:hypothetical protein